MTKRLLLILLACSSVLLAGCGSQEPITPHVMMVGGCDGSGCCAVRYSDYSEGMQRYPLRGKDKSEQCK